jgi:hypothetical protein
MHCRLCIVTVRELASELLCVGGGVVAATPPPLRTYTSRFCIILCKDDSAFFSRFLHVENHQRSFIRYSFEFRDLY